MLFAQDVYIRLKTAEFSAGRFREGVENLYYLGQRIGKIDSPAAQVSEAAFHPDIHNRPNESMNDFNFFLN